MNSTNSFVMHRVVKACAVSLAAALVLLSTMPAAVADDISPPPWERLGAENFSTSAEWDFLTDQPTSNIQPDGTSVMLIVGDSASDLDTAFPGGAPHPSGALFGTTSEPFWVEDVSNGGYEGSGNDGGIVFNVPNWYDQEPVKFVRIQITYSGDAPTTDVIGFIDGVPGTSDGVTKEYLGRVVVQDDNLPDGMSYFYDDWELRPNPDWEQVIVNIPDGTFLDQVVIDTISTVPEPTGIALALAALLGMSGLRRTRGTRE